MPVERIPIADDATHLADRLKFLNASEAGIFCGVSNFGSMAELYAEKKGLRPPLMDSAIFRRGRWGEAAVFQALTEERPEWQVQRGRVHVRDTKRRIACTPDGFATRPDLPGFGVVEAKVSARSVFKRWLDFPDDYIDGPATPPAAYRLQTLTTMMLNECSWGVLAVLVNSEFDWTLRLFEIERDAVIEERILACAATFWHDYLDPGIMPPFEPQEDGQLIKLLYPADNGTEIDLSNDNRAAIATEELIETQAAISRLEKKEDALKSELCAKLGEHTYGRLSGGRQLSWRLQHRKGYAVKPADFRVFRVLKSEIHDDRR
jgi:predicted phage-related endonuclease